MTPTLSLIVPVRDEVDNLRPLTAEVRAAMGELGTTWELLLVDDGSRDGSREAIRSLCGEDARVRGVFLDRSYGQTAAFLAGFARARGDVLVTMDADLQNDPRDAGSLLAALAEGHDLAIGVRRERHDGVLRRVSSRVANGIRSRVLGDSYTDVGCSLKAFRRQVLERMPPYAGMHRFFPILARWDGASIVQIPVSHRPRRAGRSKYGIRNRVLVAFVDMLAVRWMRSRRLDYHIVEECAGPRETAAVASRRA